jgi:hypothetical protein
LIPGSEGGDHDHEHEHEHEDEGEDEDEDDGRTSVARVLGESRV